VLRNSMGSYFFEMIVASNYYQTLLKVWRKDSPSFIWSLL
jgi:hypothetical protein